MLAELVAGNTDAVAMADLAHGKMRRKLPDLAEALTRHFDEHHALLVGAMLHRLEQVDAALRELDARIAAATALVRPAPRRRAHPPADRAAQTPRSHRGPRTRRLARLTAGETPRSTPTGLRPVLTPATERTFTGQ